MIDATPQAHWHRMDSPIWIIAARGGGHGVSSERAETPPLILQAKNK
jgi:hypothetical protein